MRPALALFAAFGLFSTALAQAPTGTPQPAPTGKPAQPAPTGATGTTGATGVTGATGQPAPTGQPANTAKPADVVAVDPATGRPMPQPPPAKPPIPVPDGPVVNKQDLEGGLILEDIKIGDGYEVKAGGAVVALYHGTLKADGTVFDSAFERGEPIAFALGGVIPGWQKGVPGMKIGGVRRLTIPAAMAYGPQARPKIPANSDLVFVIQLVDALRFEDVKVGEGEAAEGQCVAVTTHTVKDGDGKEVQKSDAAHPYIWFPQENQGVQLGLEGMKVGGKRKIWVPKEMNVQSPYGETGRPLNTALVIELELIAVRNLPKPGGR